MIMRTLKMYSLYKESFKGDVLLFNWYLYGKNTQTGALVQ